MGIAIKMLDIKEYQLERGRVKMAQRHLQKIFHPDKNPNKRSSAMSSQYTEYLQVINEANRMLLDYLSSLGTTRFSPSPPRAPDVNVFPAREREYSPPPSAAPSPSSPAPFSPTPRSPNVKEVPARDIENSPTPVGIPRRQRKRKKLACMQATPD